MVRGRGERVKNGTRSPPARVRLSIYQRLL
jgi:hypothetical protein